MSMSYPQNLVPVQPVLPVDPAYSYSDWEAIMEAQELRPERCDGCKEGTVPQPGKPYIEPPRARAQEPAHCLVPALRKATVQSSGT